MLPYIPVPLAQKSTITVSSIADRSPAAPAVFPLGYAGRLKELRQRNRTAMERRAEASRNRLRILSAKMDVLSPLKKLTGGFGYLEQDGKPVLTLSVLEPGDMITVRMRDERAKAEILSVQKEGNDG